MIMGLGCGLSRASSSGGAFPLIFLSQTRRAPSWLPSCTSRRVRWANLLTVVLGFWATAKVNVALTPASLFVKRLCSLALCPLLIHFSAPTRIAGRSKNQDISPDCSLG